jgi:SAM-dependent methyltransferase
MTADSLARRAGRRALRVLTGQSFRKPPSVMFDAEDIPKLVEVWQRTGGLPGTEWDAYRDAHMRLPAWFQHGLDPLSDAYRAQQHRLWQLIAGVDRDYDPEIDEAEEGWEDADPIRLPGFYRRRDPLAVSSAADHFFATSMLLKHCGLKPGDRALEYGSGFGQSALALARLGVQVDTVDISPRFCNFVRQQADFFQVPLFPHMGRFGLNPRPDEEYKLIWFYQSFHHCIHFQQVMLELRGMLAPGGKIILAGEPIIEMPYEALPYPWGIRLHSEVVVVVRQTRWFELGFHHSFLRRLLASLGIELEIVHCPQSSYGTLYLGRNTFRHDKKEV